MFGLSFPIIWAFVKANPLTVFKYGIFAAGIVACIAIVWRLDYLTGEKTRLSALLKTANDTITVMQDNEKLKEKISFENAQHVIKNERSRSDILLNIERSKDETCPLSPVLLDTYDRLRGTIPSGD